MWSDTSGMQRFYDPFVDTDGQPRATGRCLCGAVTYVVRGPVRDVILCHCVECRRWSGSHGAFAAAREEDLAVAEGAPLGWIESPESSRHARRGFCRECASSLFWQAAGAERISIAAGTLDAPTGLRLAAHIYTDRAADWDAIPDDELPRDPDDSFTPRWS